MKWLALKRFLHYSLIGFGTFIFDLILLTALKELAHINPVWAAGGSFLVAVSINYLLSRRFVFVGATRGHKDGYSYFLLIAGVGLLLVTAGMYILVQVLGVYFILARVLIAALTGIWNYSMNLFFNFKVVGIRHPQK